MPHAVGTFQVTSDQIKIVCDDDFGRYYRWLFHRAHHYTIKLQPPKHRSHINVILPKIHKVICDNYLHLNGKRVRFQYDVEGNYGGFTKGFVNFWLDVCCRFGENILHENGFHKERNFSMLHLTVGNSKNLK